MVKVKICGITRSEDAQAAVEAGADALGFVFYEKARALLPPNVPCRSLPSFHLS